MIKLYIIADEIKPVGLHKNLELFNIEVTWSNLNNLLSIQTMLKMLQVMKNK